MKLRVGILALLSFTLITSSCKKEEEAQKEGQVITVTGLFSITGNWSDLGIPSNAAVEIAIEEINADFEARGVAYRFTSSVYDTKLDTSLAVTAIQDAASKGIRLIIGPQSSAEVASIKSFANTNNILVVSQGSTASSLAIPNDAVYRYCPGDAIEGAAIANSIYAEGKRGLITVARNDIGNAGLQSAVNSAFTTAGGAVEIIAPYASNTTTFASLLNDIRNKVTSLSSTYGVQNVAVYLASFDEAVLLFNQAAGDSILESVHWYGGDSFTQSQAIVSDSLACSFAIATNFYAPEFGLPASAQSKWGPLKTKIQNRCGIAPDAFAISAYDIMWVMAKTIEAGNGIPASPGSLWSLFAAQTGQYTGATGPIILNGAGDRANGAFDYWGLQYSGGSYSWKYVGSSQ